MKQTTLKKSFLAALSFAFLLSVLLNIFLYSQLRKYYTLLYAIELDPLGLSAFENATPPVMGKNQPTLVFYGDSRAAQWPTPPIDGFTFINRGIGNQTTAQVLHRFEMDIEPLHPNVVILQVGINDLKTIPLFPGNSGQIVSTCEKHILEIIEKSLALNSTLVVTTIFPTGTVPLQRRLVWSAEIGEAVLEVNDYIRSLAAENVLVFDAAVLLSNETGQLKPEYAQDELHLNQAGYEILNLELVKLVRRIQLE